MIQSYGTEEVCQQPCTTVPVVSDISVQIIDGIVSLRDIDMSTVSFAGKWYDISVKLHGMYKTPCLDP